jgi:cytochrome c-type biogenesis protein CcmF
VGNAFYIGNALKGNLKKAGPSVAHIGFGLMLFGILISSSKKNVLSWNTTGISTLDARGKENPAENITLFKGAATDMGTYQVQYVRDTFNIKNNKKYFEIIFKNKDGNEAFRLYPNVIKNNKGQDGFSANPAAKHYWNKDVFAYVTSWVDPSSQKDTNSFKPVHLAIGDTAFYSNGMLILNKANVENNSMNGTSNGELKMKLDVTVLSKNGKVYKAAPGIAVRGNELHPLPDTVSPQSLIITFNKVIDEQKGILELGVKESAAAVSLLTLKVYEFPFITILWIGVIIMVTGSLMSMVRQIQKLKRKPV